jgi:hypothetical protein
MNLRTDKVNNSASTIDAHLHSWTDIKHDFHNGAILLGNGFSCAVWNPFGYSSLFEKAAAGDGIEHGLSPEDIELFDEMETKNFETVLSALSQTSQVNEIFHHSPRLFRERYEHIKLALGESVRAVHVPWDQIERTDVLHHIRHELRHYRWVFSTNYDLLVYWAIMSEQSGKDFRDYFWATGCSFDNTDTMIRNPSDTRVLYLHGALHLKRDPISWSTSKLVNDGARNILGRLDVPLFITEGSANDKRSSIRKSDYLSFAYQQLSAYKDSLVIFGHSLGDSDSHLIEAIKKNMPSKIAISIRGSNSPSSILKRKAHIRGELGPNVFFFDAATHPLGSEAMRVHPEENNVGCDAFSHSRSFKPREIPF